MQGGMQGGREGGREGRREGGRVGEREGVREGGWEPVGTKGGGRPLLLTLFTSAKNI